MCITDTRSASASEMEAVSFPLYAHMYVINVYPWIVRYSLDVLFLQPHYHPVRQIVGCRSQIMKVLMTTESQKHTVSWALTLNGSTHKYTACDGLGWGGGWGWVCGWHIKYSIRLGSWCFIQTICHQLGQCWMCGRIYGAWHLILASL